VRVYGELFLEDRLVYLGLLNSLFSVSISQGERDYLFDDHSVTTGSVFVRSYSRIVFCTFCYSSIFFLGFEKHERLLDVYPKRFNEDQHDSIFYSLAETRTGREREREIESLHHHPHQRTPTNAPNFSCPSLITDRFGLLSLFWHVRVYITKIKL